MINQPNLLVMFLIMYYFPESVSWLRSMTFLNSKYEIHLQVQYIVMFLFYVQFLLSCKTVLYFKPQNLSQCWKLCSSVSVCVA
jgi:hypothetical protein